MTVPTPTKQTGNRHTQPLKDARELYHDSPCTSTQRKGGLFLWILKTAYDDFLEEKSAPKEMLELYDQMIEAISAYCAAREKFGFEAGFEAGMKAGIVSAGGVL